MIKVLCNRTWCRWNGGEGSYLCTLDSVTLREDEDTGEFECEDYEAKEGTGR